VLLLAVTACLAINLFGCGGSSAPSATGRAVFTINWPPPGRLIPAASNSIKVDVLRHGVFFTSQVVARPAGGGPAVLTFDSLPVDTLTAAATAYPQNDGTGVAQATASVPLTINPGQTTNFGITMASTIDHVELSPSSPSVPVGQTVSLTMTAKDLAGSIVLTTPGKLSWSSANTNLASVNANGVVTGVAPTAVTPGPVQITVTETESGKTVSTALAVTSNTTVTVAPTPVDLPVGDPQNFTPTVTNAPNTAVTWSIQEGAAGGTITQTGAYTASNTVGTYHIIATSQYDNSKTGSAVVNVQ
jgi:hypothetical protein